MNTVKFESAGAFVVWITGLPASGKSAVTAELTRLLRQRGTEATVLESDTLRTAFSESPAYDEQGREYFYSSIGLIAETLASRGVPVIIDATANRKAWRERARQRIPRFVEVFIACPLDVCMRRDPKGLYRQALADPLNQMPGIGTAYEPSQCPDVIVHTEYEFPDAAAARIIETLVKRGFLKERETPEANPAPATANADGGG